MGLASAAKGEKVAAIIAYSFCSATMLVVNKIAVQELPVPTLVRCGRAAAACGPWQPL